MEKRMDGYTDVWTDKPSYRGARTHLKRGYSCRVSFLIPERRSFVLYISNGLAAPLLGGWDHVSHTDQQIRKAGSALSLKKCNICNPDKNPNPMIGRTKGNL